MYYHTRSFYQNGITLVELLISLLLSTLIFSGLLHLYFQYQRIMVIQESMRRLHFNATTVIQSLKNDIKRAGFLGCNTIENMQTVVGGERLNLNHANSLVVQKNSIAVWVADVEETRILAMPSRDKLVVSNHVSYKKDDLVVVSSCFNAEFFRVRDVKHHGDQQIIWCDVGLSQAYRFDSEVRRIHRKHYFIKKTQYDQNGQGLFVKMDNDFASEVVEGVKQMDVIKEENSMTVRVEFLAETMNHVWYLNVNLK